MRILIVDDKHENSYLLKMLLEGHGYETEIATNGAEALDISRKRVPDLVISDLFMPVMDGYTLLRQWKSDASLSNIPFIVYTATYTASKDEKLARDLGADDFIVKPQEPDVFMQHVEVILDKTIRRTLPVNKPVTSQDELSELYSQVLFNKLEQKNDELEQRSAELTLYEEALEHHSARDSLTGLANRERLLTLLQQAVNGAARRGTPVAVLLLDADQFKRINDSLGHKAGDAVLRQFSQRLQHCVSAREVLARLGGDEFAIVMTDIPKQSAIAQLAERIYRQLVAPFQVAGHDLMLDVSIGISLFPNDGDDAETLLRNADAAMYLAKQEGRNTYRFYTAELNTRALRRLDIESGLRKAMKNKELFLAYQPLVNLASGKVVSAEALLRWRSERGDIISPADFIPVAEETGQIVTIGEWVLQEACAQAVRWREQGVPLQIAVNLSARQFRDRALVSLIRHTLEVSQLPPEYLKVEITETALMDNSLEAAAILQELKGLGIGIAIDDFGTGYSSLAYLRQFPINQLKIDQSFVHEMLVHDDSAAIVRSVISLARALRLQTVAEGVETEAQRDFLAAAGCELMQGYLYSRPVSPDSIVELCKADVLAR